jgi:hypothetical protein
MKSTWESYDPFYAVIIDFIGPFAPDIHMNSYLFVVQDAFTRYVRIFPTKDNTSTTVALCLLDIHSMFTTVRIIASDNAQEFVSDVYLQLLQFISAEPSYSLPYRHQSSIERVNREVDRHIRALNLDRRSPDDPNQLVPLNILAPIVAKIINSAIHKDLGCSPTQLVLRTHCDPTLYPLPNTPLVPPTSRSEFYNQLESIQLELLLRSREYQANNTDIYLLDNFNLINHVFQPGDYVLVTYAEKSPHKFATAVMGPRLIVSRDNNEFYVIYWMILKINFIHQGCVYIIMLIIIT